MDPNLEIGYRSFEDFFEREYTTLVRALIPVAHSLDAAEEAAQDSMRRVFERWPRVAQMDSPIGYAYVTGRNSVRRGLRRAALRLIAGERQREPRAADADDPARLVGARDQLLKALSQLSSAERDALLLVTYLGLDVSEAAQTLKIKPASVRSRLHRARQSVRPFIEEEQDE
ncbi:MAG TPA: sigma-70 family RNA polymerase sigma factor [Solirubrobacterales bacterium]|nr:sigma-70 family RNA polymerase sigma factor [Solirubrobacterales bacterium]